VEKVIDKNYKPSKFYMDAYPRDNVMVAFLKIIDLVN